MKSTLRLLTAVSAFALVAACGNKEKAVETPPPAAPVEAPVDEPAAEAISAAAFDAKIAEVTRAYFAEIPETATYYGAPADLAGADAGARLNDRSPAAEKARRTKMEAALSALRAAREAAPDETRRRDADVLIAQLDGALAPARLADYGAIFNVYGFWYTPYAVLQNSGPLVDTPNLLESQHQVKSAADADAYLARLEAFGPMIDGVTEKVKADAALGATPPDFIIEKVENVIDNFTKVPAAENVLVASFAKKMKEAGLPDADARAARAATIVAETIYPAERRLLDLLAEQKKTAVHDAGVWRLPDGERLYQAMIRHMTDTTMTADEIHQKGLDEVARILSEMDAILKAEGLTEGSVGERMAALAKDPRFFYPNTEEGKAKILADIDAQVARVNAEAPKWFNTLPKYDLQVRAVPAFSQEGAPGGYYDSPALDGSRPGTYWINLRDTAIWPKFAVPTLTYHESIPGHHFQNAIALGEDAPLLMAVMSSNAFGEGWALYAEKLAKEMDLYAGDPYGDLGRLQDELHRAVRLVVDTGMHAKKWSREQAIDYVAKTEGVHPSEAVSEVERYVVWPGQALGYKIGMLRIEALRAEAEAALGDKFDIRAFHDEVLKYGAVPLPVFEANIRRWAASYSPAAPQ
ncbi:MAG: DUF885 domain-containing protein [Parvularculaceae bacterium]|nr:DUF885 domain-containing protein [Parvularculaceae bacterium]